eukprot:4246532-Amphidinium_carterae.2
MAPLQNRASDYEEQPDVHAETCGNMQMSTLTAERQDTTGEGCRPAGEVSRLHNIAVLSTASFLGGYSAPGQSDQQMLAASS